MHPFACISWICPRGRTANRGQCVTKYKALLRPAFIGGSERERDTQTWGGAGGENRKRGELLLEGLL